MEKKLLIAFEIIFIIGALGYYTYKEIIPDLKTRFGSSDRIVNPEKCVNIIEVKVDNNIDYMYLVDENKNTYHIIFFTPQSMVLYNKNIEKYNMDESLSLSVKLLIENNYLKKDSLITIIKENDTHYSEFSNGLKKNLQKYHINTNITEETSNFIDKAFKLDLNANTRSTMITEMDYYSKELINANIDKTKTNIILDKTSSKTLSNNVYKKIEKYINSNNIINLEKNNTKLIITTIPADNDTKYYPTQNSWYYIKNKKVFAYIELQDGNNKYGYCYNGSIDNIKEGECEVNEENKH